MRTCALPYPSDEFTVVDEGSPTGRRVAVPEGLVPAVVTDRLGPGATLEDAFAGADGFSALSPVVFELEAPVRSEQLPADGGQVLQVLDSATGERQEIRAEVWPEALVRGAPATVVMAWPATRWEYGHTYVARIGGIDGVLGALRAPKAVAEGTGPLGGIRQELHLLGDTMEWADVLQATRFTVGSRAEVLSDVERMTRLARADDHPVRNLESRPPLLFEHGAATVSGEVRITDFRDADGVVRAEAPPAETWVPFLLTVPEVPASPSGAPVAVYGHGLTINKESMLIVASANAAHGVATIGIDVPNHGGRQAGQGGYLLDLTRPDTLGRLVGIALQGIADHASLVDAVLEHLDTLDLSPWRMTGAPGDGVADLDASVLLYEGTSMGGVLGAAEYALVPELEAAFLQVSGLGIVDILLHSWLWPFFSTVIPANATAGEAAALVGAASMLLDPAEPTHLMDELLASGRPVLAQVGVGDRIVPEFASDRLVRMLDLPRIGRALTGIRANGDSDRLGPDGRGFAETWPTNSSPDNQGLVAHVSFAEPSAQALLDEWLAQRLASAGLVPPP